MTARGLICADPLEDGLSVRARDQLARLGIHTREEALLRLGPDAAPLLKLRGWGMITIKQVRQWLSNGERGETHPSS